MALFDTPTVDARDAEVIDAIHDLQHRLRYHVAQPRRWSGLLRRVNLARAIRGSNTIEGFTVTEDDAFAALDDVEPAEASGTAWAAVRGYRTAMTYVLQLAEEPTLALSVDLIRSLHFMMQSYDLTCWPGRWRPGPVYVFDSDAAETVYEPPEASAVPVLMVELVDRINAATEDPQVVRAAMAHLNLVMIHPFKDGNGRMARCLQTLLLAREGATAPEFCSIEEQLGRSERDYYRVLADVGAGTWSPGRDAHPWLRFCLTAHYRQVLRVVRASRRAERLWIIAEREIDGRGLPDRCTDGLFHALGLSRLRNATYRQIHPDLSNNLASRDLAEMVRAGLLDSYGEKRGRYYTISARLRQEAMTVLRDVRAEHPLDADPYR